VPDHLEVETKDLQEAIDELHEERAERGERRDAAAWIGYIGLTTALLAVFAAIGALQSGNLVNEALINQVKASDTWNEYQASRQKDHLYALALNALLDANAGNPALRAQMKQPVPKNGAPAAGNGATAFAAKPVAARAFEYRTKIAQEAGKEKQRFDRARAYEDESAAQLTKQHFFEYSVALIQVAIALGAVSALTRVRPVWYASMLAGGIGIVLFAFGFVA
jgi:hypothetical protein